VRLDRQVFQPRLVGESSAQRFITKFARAELYLISDSHFRLSRS